MESKEYTYNELMQMQEQAIRRVRDMQERARITLEEHSPVQEDKKPPEAEKKIERPVTNSEQPKRTARPEPVPKKPGNDKGMFGDLLKMDKDKALILPILMLLGKDTTDSILLIALMYIMS